MTSFRPLRLSRSVLRFTAGLALGLAGALSVSAQTTGLWLGEATLAQVAQVADGAGGAPVATPAPFRLSLLLHVDTGGQVRVLKEVWQMKTRASVPADVLVINPALLSAYDGVIDRGGTLVAARWSTAFFPYGGVTPPTLAGSFAGGSTLTGSLTLAASDPTNPYRHKFHPDHENGATVVRALTLTLAAPVLGDPPGTGVSRFTGTYAESVTGLHTLPLKAAGPVSLTRLNTLGTLVQ